MKVSVRWTSGEIYETLCAIWYHVYKLKKVKSTHVGVLLSVIFTKSNTLLHGFFSRSLNYTNGTKSRKALHEKCSFYMQSLNKLKIAIENKRISWQDDVFV